MYRILSIDGGGIRGVIPAVLLAQMEKRTGRPVSELFDLIAGTSTGGILAAGLTVPDLADPAVPKCTARQLLALYEKRGEEIFTRSFWDGVSSVGGLADEKYPSDGIENVLEDVLGEASLADTLTDILVTSYDIHERRPYFFKSTKAREGGNDRNHRLRDAARATSAAPTYFEPARTPTHFKALELPDSDAIMERFLIDGGVFCNNPALCAYAEARSNGEPPEDILLVSLGTGVATRKIPYERARGWGKIEWLQPVLSVIMDGMADAVDYQLRQLLPDADDGPRYCRFNIRMTEALDDMDAAHAANIEALKREARRILDGRTEQGKAFSALCERL